MMGREIIGPGLKSPWVRDLTHQYLQEEGCHCVTEFRRSTYLQQRKNGKVKPKGELRMSGPAYPASVVLKRSTPEHVTMTSPFTQLKGLGTLCYVSRIDL